MGIETTVADPIWLARVLLVGAGLVFALLRLREVREPVRRRPLRYGVDLVLALAIVFLSGPFDDLVTSLAHISVLIPLAAGLILGLAGMATTGLSAAVMFIVFGGGTNVVAWFVTPLVAGAAMRNIRLKPTMPTTEDRSSSALYATIHGLPKLPGGMSPMLPGPHDMVWGAAARLICVVPLVCVFLVPGDGDLGSRIVGAVLVGWTLLAYDVARRPLLMPHRRVARITDTGVFMALLVVASGPLGELIARWWVSNPWVNAWHVGQFAIYAGVLDLLTTPRIDKGRTSWLLTRSTRFVFAVSQIMVACATFPFLVGGVFHPAHGPLSTSIPVLSIGLLYGWYAGRKGAGTRQQIADVMLLLRATHELKGLLLDGWVTDTFYRRRWRFIPRPWNYLLPRMTAVTAEVGAVAASATSAVHVNLPWGGRVKVDHTTSTELLRLAEQILDTVDNAYPPTEFGPGTRLHRAQQVARADLALRRGTVAQYLDDFEASIAAANQAAVHYTVIGAHAHAADVRIFTANRLSDRRQHEAATALLADIPEDLPPVIHRLLLVIRAAAAHRADRTAAARTLLAAARAIPARSALDFHKAFAAERIDYPSFGKGSHQAMVRIELNLDRELGGTHPYPK